MQRGNTCIHKYDSRFPEALIIISPRTLDVNQRIRFTYIGVWLVGATPLVPTCAVCSDKIHKKYKSVLIEKIEISFYIAVFIYFSCFSTTMLHRHSIYLLEKIWEVGVRDTCIEMMYFDKYNMYLWLEFLMVATNFSKYYIFYCSLKCASVYIWPLNVYIIYVWNLNV